MSITHKSDQKKNISHPRFARYYERMMGSAGSRAFIEPFRRETAGLASGVVLEVGAGNGLNFAFYNPARVERVEAIEPDPTMFAFARQRLDTTSIPITLTSATAEKLPFSAATFDSVVVGLVFCSVDDPVGALHEIKRVLKPGGSLFLLEHVRSQNRFVAHIQDILVPLTTRLAGNCHWNRDTLHMVQDSGFTIKSLRRQGGGFHPIILVQATHS